MTKTNLSNRRSYEIERNLEDVTLIWCDPNIDHSSDSRHTQRSLRELNHYVQFYTNPQLCLEYIRSIRDERIILVLSNVFEKQILSEVCSFPTICSIFLLCIDGQSSVSIPIPTKYEKMVQSFTDKKILLQSIHPNSSRNETNNRIQFILWTKTKINKKCFQTISIVSWLSNSIQSLKKLPRTDRALDEMIDKCSDYYQSNQIELKRIEQF